MGNLRHRMSGLQARLYCPIHRDEPLACSECDLLELTDDEWDELAVLLEQAGYFDQEPLPRVATCWRCGEGALCCLACAHVRGEPPGMALMCEAAVDRLHELAAKLVPPWL
jgi:hypothetical protein